MNLLVKFIIDGETRFLSKAARLGQHIFTSDKEDAYFCKTECDAKLTIRDVKIIYGYCGEIEPA
jgi:hypothetical protein